MFGIDDQVTQKPTAPFPIGENVADSVLTKVEFNPDGDYGPQLCFHISRTNGEAQSTLKDWRTFPVTGKVKARKDETDEQAFKREAQDLNSIIRHYCNMVGDHDDMNSKLGINPDANSFGQKVAQVINDTLTADGCPALYVKTYKNDAGYARMSKYPPFLQKMDEGDGELAWSPWEKKQVDKVIEPAESGAVDETEGSGEELSFLD